MSSRFPRTRTLALTLLLLAPAAAVPLAEEIQPPRIEHTTHRLSNGLTVLLHEDHSTPIVAVNLWYHVGSKNERPGRTGFAHLFEHMMFQGSKNYNNDFFKALEPLGATDLNGTTNSDRTNYFENVPAHALERALWLEADRMGWLLPALTQERLDNQIEVVKNERRQRVENEPYGLVTERMLAALYPAHHPYHWPTIGFMSDLTAAAKTDVEEFFKTWYGPNNCTLVIAGDIDPARTLALVENYFGSIPSGPPVSRPEAWMPELPREVRLRMEDRVSLPRLYLSWHAPGAYQDGEADLDVLAGVLAGVGGGFGGGGGKTSRLYKRLVYDLQVAQDVSSFLEARELSGLFQVRVTAKEGRTLEEIEPLVLEEIERLRREPPTSDEVEGIRTAILSRMVRGLDRIGGFGGKSDLLGRYATYAKSPDYIADDFARYQSVTPASVRAAAEHWLVAGRVNMQVVPFGEGKAAPEVAGLDRSVAPPLGGSGSAKLPAMRQATLSNGLTLIVAETRKIPMVQMSLLVRGGASTDAPNKLGLASFTAGMLDEGTRSRSALDLSEKVQGLGATLSTRSSLDAWVVGMSALKARLEPSMAIWADVILNPSFPEDEIERQRKQALGRILQEKRQPAGLGTRIMPSIVYGPGHPYAQPGSGTGTEATVSALTQADMTAAHSTWFRPGNAVAIVVGDTTLEEVRPLIEKHLGGWKAAKTPELKVPAVSPAPERAVYVVDKPGAAQSVLLAAAIGVPKNNPDDVPFQVLNHVLGGSFTSRINMNLREDKGYTYGARSAHLATRGQGVFFGSTQVRTNVTKESIAEMLKEFDEIRGQRPITGDELKVAQEGLTLSLPGRFESLGEIAAMIEEIVTYDLPTDYYDRFPQAVRAVSIPSLTEMGKRRIPVERLAILVVGDRSVIQEGIESLNLGPIRYLDADGNPVTAGAQTQAQAVKK